MRHSKDANNETLSRSDGAPVAVKRRGGRLWRCVKRVLVFVAGVVVLVAVMPVTVWVYSLMDSTRDADVAIVLGAAVITDKPSPVFAQRIQHGIDLYKQGRVKKLLFTGAQNRFDTRSEAGAGRDMAVEQGVPDEDILLEEMSGTTWGNVVYSWDIMRREGLDVALVVSDPMHMFRAMAMTSRVGMRAYSSPTPTSMYKSFRERSRFCLREAMLYVGFALRHLADWPVSK